MKTTFNVNVDLTLEDVKLAVAEYVKNRSNLSVGSVAFKVADTSDDRFCSSPNYQLVGATASGVLPSNEGER